MSVSYDAVLLMAFGGPTSPQEIRPFIERVVKGIPVPPQRIEEVARHYEAVGGKSPLTEITFRQSALLEQALRQAGLQLPVFVGLRHSVPFIKQTLQRMAGNGVKRGLGFILSSHQTEASWERYQEDVSRSGAELDGQALEIDYCPPWYDHPLFIQSWVERIESVLGNFAPENRAALAIVFTAHSVPAPMAARSPYTQQISESARSIAASLGHQRCLIAYQSRSGRPTEPWLEPDIGRAIRDLATEGVREVVIAPIGFVCDHVEVLYDLDMEARKIAEDLGVRFARAACPNDHPTFIRMMAEVIKAALDSTST
ncbi:MAG: ferrochelatase [Deltaproteobacteria bacterium]|nr:ferrochelatase [Deltaproteobacteria bacterium]